MSVGFGWGYCNITKTLSDQNLRAFVKLSDTACNLVEHY